MKRRQAQPMRRGSARAQTAALGASQAGRGKVLSLHEKRRAAMRKRRKKKKRKARNPLDAILGVRRRV